MKNILATIFCFTVSGTLLADTPVFHCVGTEPFWSLNVSEKEKLIRFRSPEGNVALKILSKRVALGSSSYGAFIMNTRYSSLMVAPAECSDGMSDNVYTHSAILDMGPRKLYYGCCDIDSAFTE